MGSPELKKVNGNCIMLCGATVAAFNHSAAEQMPFFYKVHKIEPDTASFIVRSHTGNEYRISVEQIKGED